MNFLGQAPQFFFFTGKGGVGKTSLSCATAIRFAEQGKRVLLVSTDPASNVAQVFEQKIGHVITPIHAVTGLSALEIDPMKAAQAYRAKIVDPVRGILPDDIVNSIEEQLSGACTTEIAAFDEFTALLTDTTLAENYEHIIFDTAPTGHTIRLLQLPGAWSGFLENNSGDGASCLGPLAGLEKQRQQYQMAVSVLSDTSRTRLVLVARAQTATLREVARTHEELSNIGLKQQHLVINGVLPIAETSHDGLAQAVYEREQASLNALPSILKQLPSDTLPLKSFNLVGLDALRGMFSDHDILQTGNDIKTQSANSFPSLASLVDELAQQKQGLIMLMGKGGVGKTTLAAAIAVALAKRGFPVHLSTSDPAAHLRETLNGTLPDLTVSAINPEQETERYRRQVLETKGKNLDEDGRLLLEEDLRSPCTEEIAVFQAFSRIIKQADDCFVIMDTAPTGHTLLLLDATGAYHREVVRLNGDGQSMPITPMAQLQDPRKTKVILVTLAETTPVLEAANLQEDLRRAKIEPWAWIVNNSLTNTQTSSGLLSVRANRELSQIEVVATRYASRMALVALQKTEPVGVDNLGALMR